MQKISIKNSNYLDISTPGGYICTGGNQEWYEQKWHKMSGCGPVAASNLVWYQAHSREELGALCENREAGFAGYTNLMDTMFKYITPGKGGVHSSKLFIPGLLDYCNDRKLEMAADFIDVPRMPRDKPTIGQVTDFLSKWLDRDCPVAFLNLSNGSLNLPDSWHWVTILALDTESMNVLISDEGRTYKSDIGKWLETSFLGGAFVTLYKP